MTIIGELINSTRKSILPLLETRDEVAIVSLARKQLDAGAHLIDVNCAALMSAEAGCLEWAVRTIQDALNARISLDSPNTEALRRGLEAHRGKALLNSISMEHERWNALLPLVREFRPAVIALCMDEGGIPAGVEGRLAAAGRLVDGLTEAGVPPDDIYLDPLLLPVATNSTAGATFLAAVGQLRVRFPGVHLICGLSNVSFGLPLRSLINQVFLVLALARGVDAFILDPLDRRLMADLVAAQMLLGRDEFCQHYIRAVRSGRLDFLRPGSGRR